MTTEVPVEDVLLPVLVADHIDALKWIRGEQMPETVTSSMAELAAFTSLHSLFDAMYHVHGQEELDWLMAAPRSVMMAYSRAGAALRDLTDSRLPSDPSPA